MWSTARLNARTDIIFVVCKRNMEDVSFSSPLTNSNITEEKDPQLFLKDIRINNINRLIIGQPNINSLRNKFQPLSTMINGSIGIFIIFEISLMKLFQQHSFLCKAFAIPIDLIVIATSVVLYSSL